MKVKLLLLGCVFSSIKISYAQKFDAGLFAGMTISQVDGDHLDGFHKAGLSGGGFVSRKISPQMMLRFEMEFIQKGSRMPLNDDGYYFLLRLNYIEVPLLLCYAIGTRWNIEAGAAFATLVSAREEDQAGTISNSPDFHKADYLVEGGGRYRITEHLMTTIRYSYSVATIRPKNENYNYYYSSKGQFNKVLSFSLAYQF